MSISSEMMNDQQQQQASEEAYYHFVLSEFLELVEVFGKDQVRHDLKKLSAQFRANRKSYKYR